MPRQASQARFRPHGVADAPDTLAPIERALAGEPVCGLDLEVVQADGTGRWVKLTALPLSAEPSEGSAPPAREAQGPGKETGKDRARNPGKDATKEAGKDAGPRPAGAVVLVLDVGEARSWTPSATSVAAWRTTSA